MTKDRGKIIERKLDDAIGLLQHLVALELARDRVPKQAIAKHIHIATATVVKMRKGVKKYGGSH